MDLWERNQLRRAALEAVDPDERRALALDRLLMVVEDAEGSVDWAADFGVEAGTDFPWVRPRPTAPKRSDDRWDAILDGGGLKILTLPVLRDLDIREVRVREAFAAKTSPKEIRAFFHAEELCGVTRIVATGVPIGSATKHLANTPQLGALRELEASQSDLDLKALAKATNLSSLSFLGARGAKGTGDDLAALLESAALPQLARLDLGTDLLARGTGRLAESSAVSRLQALRIVGPEKPSSEHWRALLGNPHLSGLRFLDLGAQPIDAAVAALVLHDERFSGLHTLGIGGSTELLRAPIDVRLLRSLHLYAPDDQTLVSLSNQPLLERLEELHLDIGDGFTGKGFEALFGSGRLTALRKIAIRLTWGAITPGALAAACRVPAGPITHVAILGAPVGPAQLASLLEQLRPGVEYLRLDGALEGEGARLLAASDRVESLKYLDLRGAKLGDGARDIATSARLRRLQALDLSGKAIDEATCEALLSESWPRLVELRLRLVKAVGDTTRRRLAQHANMPDLWVLSGLQLPPEDGRSAVSDLRTVHLDEPGMFPYDALAFPRLT